VCAGAARARRRLDDRPLAERTTVAAAVRDGRCRQDSAHGLPARHGVELLVVRLGFWRAGMPTAGFDEHLVVACERSSGPLPVTTVRIPSPRTVDPQPGAADVVWESGGEHQSSVVATSSTPRPDNESTTTTGQSARSSTCSASSGVLVDERRFRQRDHPVADLEQVEDLHVLLGLASSFVRSNHEWRDIDRRPGEHVLHEPNMARNVDEAHDLTRQQRAGARPEVDRQTALSPPGTDQGQCGGREDERRLAVINMARGRDDSHPAPGPARCVGLLTAR
jgi:hypothetical protein